MAACDHTTCPSGCCYQGVCRPGIEGAACGTGGGTCAECVGATEVCRSKACVPFDVATLNYSLGSCGAGLACTVTVRLTETDFASLKANPDYALCSFTQTAAPSLSSPAAYTVMCQGGYRTEGTGNCVILAYGTCCQTPMYANTNTCAWSPPGAF